MFRLLAVLMLLLATVTSRSAPALKGNGPVLYYPTTVGTRWSYQDPRHGNTFAVTRVEEKDGGFLVEVGLVSGEQVTPTQEVRVSAEGVFRVSIGGVPRAEPECLLKLPHKDGQEWEFDLGPANGGKSKLTAIGRESVETPAGKFDAIKVERVGGNPATYWFAEGVGLVKYTSGKSETVLKSHTPGRKK